MTIDDPVGTAGGVVMGDPLGDCGGPVENKENKREKKGSLDRASHRTTAYSLLRPDFSDVSHRIFEDRRNPVHDAWER